MHLPDHILGKGTVETLQERINAPVLVIGSDRFTRAHLAATSCFNFNAASNLTRIIATLKVENTRDLYHRIPPRALALPGLGSIALAVLGAALEHKLDKNLSDYIDKHRAEQEAIVTFTTMKNNTADSKADRKAKKDEKTRSRNRGRQAHEIRVGRHMHRATRGGAVATVTS